MHISSLSLTSRTLAGSEFKPVLLLGPNKPVPAAVITIAQGQDYLI